jgi:hypothetical protein
MRDSYGIESNYVCVVHHGVIVRSGATKHLSPSLPYEGRDGERWDYFASLAMTAITYF